MPIGLPSSQLYEELPVELLEYFSRRSQDAVPVVEIYERNQVDIASNEAPANALARFAKVCYTWQYGSNSYTYEPKITSFPEIGNYLGDRINLAEIEISNVRRGDGNAARFVLTNQLKGCWMVIRLLFPDLPQHSMVLFWGKCKRPGRINDKSVLLSATQDLGNYNQELPVKIYQTKCPLGFGIPGGGCLGNQTLAEKSPAYQQEFSEQGFSGCADKSLATCTRLGNAPYYQGQLSVAVNGQFSYTTTEEVVKTFLFWTRKKKKTVVKTEAWSSVNQSENNEVVPLAFGRTQLVGHPFTWADVGAQVKSLQGFCEGKIAGFHFIRPRVEGVNILQSVQHLGDWGGVGTQVKDTLFNGASGYNSRLAYLELLTDGSDPSSASDSAPLVTAVVMGLEIPLPDANGNYTTTGWSNNPVHTVRYLFTADSIGKIPSARIDDSYNILEADYCDTLVEDATGSEVILIPANEADTYGTSYRRYRSTTRYSAYRDMWEHGDVPNIILEDHPALEQPYIIFNDPFSPPPVLPRTTVLRQLYGINGALQDKGPMLDFVTSKVLPTFKGFIQYAPNGKIRIRCKRPADNGYVREAASVGATRIGINSVRPWLVNRQGFVILGVSREDAEIRRVRSVQFSTAGNDLPIAVSAGGGVSCVTAGNFSGGSTVSPATSYLDFSGTVIGPDAYVSLSFNTGDNLFTVSYVADGLETPECFVRMVLAHLNANPEFRNDLIAYVNPAEPLKIQLKCDAGYLVLDKPLLYARSEGEEILRVRAVFENCNDLDGDAGAYFDNIIDNSFTWNDEEQEEVNAVSAKYVSAIDDFHLTELAPRVAWQTVHAEGEFNKYEMDLRLVDNYWQAAYLAKSEAIERIDGNLPFSWSSGASALRLTIADVVAIRHDSGDGALRYVPAYLTAVQPNLDTMQVRLNARLYLSAAYDLHVQPIDPILTTTLNSATITAIPAPIGTTGGVGGGTEPRPLRGSGDYYKNLNIQQYSPTGMDRI